MTYDVRITLRRALLTLRVALALYVIYWGVQMATAEGPSLLFADWPGLAPAPALGWIEVGVGVLVLLGALRGLSYGLAFFLQAAATFASHEPIIAAVRFGHMPGENGFQLAAIPVLAAAALLFALRDQDTLLALDHLIQGRRKRPDPGAAHAKVSAS